jgi:hypothetical protein
MSEKSRYTSIQVYPTTADRIKDYQAVFGLTKDALLNELMDIASKVYKQKVKQKIKELQKE